MRQLVRHWTAGPSINAPPGEGGVAGTLICVSVGNRAVRLAHAVMQMPNIFTSLSPRLKHATRRTETNSIVKETTFFSKHNENQPSCLKNGVVT